MIVYRVEKDGTGPYCNGFIEKIKQAEIHYYEGSHFTHPAPKQDEIKKYHSSNCKDRRCGFISKNRLNKWFSGLQHLLREAGYSIGVYEVDSKYVSKGKVQLVFDVSKAKLIKSLRLSKKGKTPVPLYRE